MVHVKSFRSWIWVPFFICYPMVILGAFSTGFYPFIDPARGGGKPRSIIMVLRETYVAPRQQYRYLIEESSDSFYVVEQLSRKARAHYIPRSDVAQVIYK